MMGPYRFPGLIDSLQLAPATRRDLASDTRPLVSIEKHSVLPPTLYATDTYPLFRLSTFGLPFLL